MAKSTTTLSALEALALGKFNPAPFIDPRPEPGMHHVDFLLRCSGNLVVAPDYEQLFVTSADLTRILHELILAQPAIGLEDLVKAAYGREADTKNLTARLRALIEKQKPKTACRGTVRGDLTFARRAG